MTRKNRKPPKITPQLTEATKALLLARAYRQTISPIVTAYQTEIMERHQFRIAQQWIDRGDQDRIITKPNEAYLLSDEDSGILYAEFDAAARGAGFDLPPGYCPLLVAESQERIAENAVIEAAEYIAGLSLDNVNGILFKHRQPIIENTVGLVLALTGMKAADVMAAR